MLQAIVVREKTALVKDLTKTAEVVLIDVPVGIEIGLV
jgi:hypothetical protein